MILGNTPPTHCTAVHYSQKKSKLFRGYKKTGKNIHTPHPTISSKSTWGVPVPICTAATLDPPSPHLLSPSPLLSLDPSSPTGSPFPYNWSSRVHLETFYLMAVPPPPFFSEGGYVFFKKYSWGVQAGNVLWAIRRRYQSRETEIVRYIYVKIFSTRFVDILLYFSILV